MSGFYLPGQRIFLLEFMVIALLAVFQTDRSLHLLIHHQMDLTIAKS